MASELRRCLAVGLGAAWLLVAPAHAEDAAVVAKGMPDKAGPAGSPALPQRVSPYAKYAQAHGEGHKGETSPRVSGLSIHRTHRAARRATQ